MTKYPNLFSPIKIGALTLKNRISYSPTFTGFVNVSGEVSRLMLDYYGRIARGGAAMVYIGAVSVDWPKGRIHSCGLRADDDRFIYGLNKLSETIQKNGGISVLQLFHAGMYADVDEPVGPTEMPGTFLMEQEKTKKVRPLKTEEVEALVETFSQAALRAKKAGFDMVDLHGGSGYLINDFYSPHTNRRLDKYGGSFENRIRFPLEIIARIKALCGEDYPVSFTLTADELRPGGSGFSLSEGIAFAKELERVGISYIICRAGLYETLLFGEGILGTRSPAGATAPIFSAVKKQISIPVGSFAKIHDPDFMEEILRDGKADIIHTARALIADPELPKKTKAGNLDNVRRCLSCCICMERTNNFPMNCTVNPTVGLEDTECSIEIAKDPKRIVVVGGGPGGMEAARVAALRGHKVTLFEKGNELGGQLNLVALGLGKEVYRTYLNNWLASQCKKAGVEIVLNKEATPKDILEIKPDAVIIATGATYPPPSIPGISGENVYSFRDVLTKKAALSGKKVVVIGGGIVGTEVADLLAETGSKVTIVEMLPEIGAEMVFSDKAYVMQKFVEYKVQLRPNVAAQEVTDEGVIVMDRKWNKELIKADAVVFATGGTSTDTNNFVKVLDGKVPEIHVIGDAKKPRKVYNAIQEGFYVGRVIV